VVVNVSFPCLIPLAVIANHFAGGFGYHTNDARGAASRTAANSGGQYVPESVDMVIDSGIILHNLPHFSRLRSLSSLAPFWSSRTELTQSSQIHSEASSLFYLRLGYQFNPRYSIAVDVYNLLNTHAQDIAYYYPRG
jgi:outer membrane receptor protein involved in Fe transport